MSGTIYIRALYIQSSGGMKNSASWAKKVRITRRMKKIICFRSQQKRLPSATNRPQAQSELGYQVPARENSEPSRSGVRKEILRQLRTCRFSSLAAGWPVLSGNSDQASAQRRR